MYWSNALRDRSSSIFLRSRCSSSSSCTTIADSFPRAGQAAAAAAPGLAWGARWPGSPEGYLAPVQPTTSVRATRTALGRIPQL